MSECTKIPRHVAIIMDGNGRWAQSRGLDRLRGHMQGVESVRTAVESSLRHGVRYLTLYVFSTENWGRPADEVNGLMALLCESIVKEAAKLAEQGVSVRVIGDRDSMSEKVQKHLAMIERETASGEKLTLILALNYSSRHEIARAIGLMIEAEKQENITVAELGPESLRAYLYTADFPDPDLIIRTSGECRLSNFLLWQAAYSEFYFTEVLWPDFGAEDFDKAVAEYGARDRRYGLITK